MKILHSCQSLSRSFGGVFEAVRQLTEALAIPDGLLEKPKEDQVIFREPYQVCVTGQRDGQFEKDRATWQPAINVRPYQRSGPASFGYSPELGKLYLEFQPDVTHVHGLWMWYGIANTNYCRKHGIPSIISPHGMLDPWALRNSGAKKKFARWLFENRNLNSASCLHALCRSEAESLRALGFRNPICIIPNGVHLPAEQGSDALPPWADAFETGTKVLLFLGRLHPKKGLDPLLQAWMAIPETELQRSGWRLAIAGWGDNAYTRQLIQLAMQETASIFADPCLVMPKPPHSEAQRHSFCPV